MDFHIKYGSPGYVHNRGTLLLCVILEVEIVYSFHVIFATDLNLEKINKNIRRERCHWTDLAV